MLRKIIAKAEEQDNKYKTANRVVSGKAYLKMKDEKEYYQKRCEELLKQIIKMNKEKEK